MRCRTWQCRRADHASTLAGRSPARPPRACRRYGPCENATPFARCRRPAPRPRKPPEPHHRSGCILPTSRSARASMRRAVDYPDLSTSPRGHHRRPPARNRAATAPLPLRPSRQAPRPWPSATATAATWTAVVARPREQVRRPPPGRRTRRDAMLERNPLAQRQTRRCRRASGPVRSQGNNAGSPSWYCRTRCNTRVRRSPSWPGAARSRRRCPGSATSIRYPAPAASRPGRGDPRAPDRRCRRTCPVCGTRRSPW